jgi:tetratricopeptide (TPR) repeat protein
MRLVCVLSAALLVASPVAAAQRGGAKSTTSLVREGERLFKERKYRESAEALKKAHEQSPSPLYIFNIAVALEYAGELRESLSWYQQYIDAEGTDPALVKRSARSVDKLRLLLDKEEQSQASAQAERQRLQQETEAARRKAEQEQLAARRAEEENQRRGQAEYERALKSYKRQKVAAFAVGGLALAGAGAGVFFGLQAKDAREQFDSARSVEDKEDRASDTRGKSLLADVGFGVGVAGALTAILLYPKDSPPAQGEVRVTLAPRGAGAGMEVSF